MKYLFALMLAVLNTYSAQTYFLTELGDGTNSSVAFGINNHGFAVGYQISNGLVRPYLWAPNRGRMQLPTTENGMAYAINDDFIIVGTAGNISSYTRFPISNGSRVAWYFDTNFVEFKFGAGAAFDVNSQGQVAGCIGAPDSAYSFNLFTGSEYVSDQPTSSFYGVNNAGNMVGHRFSYNDLYPVFAKADANGNGYTYIMEKSLHGSSAFGINSSNEVVGAAFETGFYWNPESGSTVKFGTKTACYDINDQGTTVGSTNGRACMWNKDKQLTDLNRLVNNTNVVLETAYGINEFGQIVGQCRNVKTRIRSAFLLTPAKQIQTRIKVVSEGVEFSWDTIPDHNYGFKASVDLKSWETLPEIYQAETESACFTVPAEDIGFLMVYDLTPQ